MFDWYEPVPSLRCPFCDFVLTGWQGKQAAACLFVWRQGEARPVDQRVDTDARASADVVARAALPETFRIYTNCPNDGQPLEAVGRCTDGVWTETSADW